jgi:TIR domain/Pentapeptide repeats (8 copies)
MDRDEALKLLMGGKEGIAEWNWRRMAGEAIPSLNAARLPRADLMFADLRGADLSEAILCEARLNLASLCRVDLGRADLNEADLGWADLSEANLSGAALSGANFHNANLRYAVLIGADFSFANFDRTIIADVDLSTAIGLNSVRHSAPSTIGVDTLVRSDGDIPEAFLRGSGVPDALIEYLHSLIGSMSPIQFYSCFISHSSKDQAFADRLHSRMVQEKLRAWYAPEDMRGGRKNVDQIDQAIRIHEKFLLVLSEPSMQSAWVETELRAALQRERRESRQSLFPIRLSSMEAVKEWRCIDPDTGSDMALEVRKYHIPDFSNWKDHDSFEAAFAGLLEDLKRDIDPGNVQS